MPTHEITALALRAGLKSVVHERGRNEEATPPREATAPPEIHVLEIHEEPSIENPGRLSNGLEHVAPVERRACRGSKHLVDVGATIVGGIEIAISRRGIREQK